MKDCIVHVGSYAEVYRGGWLFSLEIIRTTLTVIEKPKK
jgi:hypothetical protein